MAVASKWVSPGTDSEWSTIPQRTRVAMPLPLSICGGQFSRRGIWFGFWSCAGLLNTPTSDDVIQPLAQVICSAEDPARRGFEAIGWSVALLFWQRSGACFARAALASFHLLQPQYFAEWFPPQPQHLGCTRGVEHPPNGWEPPRATHVGAYPQLRCVCPKRWQRWHCSGPFGATYDSIDTRKPQSSVSDCALDNSGPHATDTMKWGWEGAPWLCDSLDWNVMGLELIWDDTLRHTPTQIFHQNPQTAVVRERADVESHFLFPLKGPHCDDQGSEPVVG